MSKDKIPNLNKIINQDTDFLSHHLFQKIYDSSIDAIILIDAETGLILDVNSTLIKNFGYKYKEIVGRGTWEIELFKNIFSLKKEFLFFVQTEFPKLNQIPIITKENNVVMAEVFYNLLEINKKKILQIQIRNILHRNLAKIEFIKEHKKLNETFNFPQIGSCVWNVKNDKSYWSDEMFRLFGYKPYEVEPSHSIIKSHVYEKDKNEFNKKYKSILNNKPDFENFELRIIRKDNQLRYLRFQIKLFYNYIKELEKISGIVEDITARKKAEKDIENYQKKLRELTMHIEDVREKERTKIALDLHDDLGQKLTVLNMDINWVKRNVDIEKPELKSKFDSMSELILNTIKTVQTLSSELRPNILYDLGLTDALEWQINEFEKRTGIKSGFEIFMENLAIDPQLSIAIFRIVQEALTNITRHANASEMKLKLKKENHNLRLLIEDNGKGIDENDINNPKSFGLTSIKERVRSYGGNVLIKGNKNKGTVIDINLPLTNSE